MRQADLREVIVDAVVRAAERAVCDAVLGRDGRVLRHGENPPRPDDRNFFVLDARGGVPLEGRVDDADLRPDADVADDAERIRAGDHVN